MNQLHSLISIAILLQGGNQSPWRGIAWINSLHLIRAVAVISIHWSSFSNFPNMEQYEKIIKKMQIRFVSLSTRLSLHILTFQNKSSIYIACLLCSARPTRTERLKSNLQFTDYTWLHPGKLTWQGHPFEDVSPIRRVIFHCHVSFRGRGYYISKMFQVATVFHRNSWEDWDDWAGDSDGRALISLWRISVMQSLITICWTAGGWIDVLDWLFAGDVREWLRKPSALLCLHCNTSPLGSKSLKPFCAYIQWVLVRRKVISSKCPCRYSALHLCTVSTQFLSQWLRQRLPGLSYHNRKYQGFKFTAAWAGWLVGLVGWLVGWLIGLVGWLVGWVGWLGRSPSKSNQPNPSNQPTNEKQIRSWCCCFSSPRGTTEGKQIEGQVFNGRWP